MIVENSGLDGLQSDLAYFDETAEKIRFLGWQWEDCAVEGKLERPDTALTLVADCIGRTAFPYDPEYELEF